MTSSPSKHIKAEKPSVRIVGLPMHADKHLAEAIRKAGNEAFVNKMASPAEVLKAIYGFCELHG